MNDTIAAIATPPGRGGVGIVRVSGPAVVSVAEQVLGIQPKPRYAHYGPFYDISTGTQQVLDEGIALYFPNPHSFTGEDVLELQGHGGPVILDILLKRVLACGVRLARPGEFSERAFLNDKLDLTQAEAIADLIDASSEQAARSAVRSLQGEFSQKIHHLVDQLIHLRMYTEAAIDFPEEEIDFLADGVVEQRLQQIRQSLKNIIASAHQGALLRDGMQVVLAGRPNAGKSSLLNALTGRESAIVTDIAGTTRDLVKEQINLDGMPMHIIDTAGLREAPDRVEQIGIERAWEAIHQADRVLLLVDASETDALDPETIWPDFVHKLPTTIPITVIRNKCDLSGEPTGFEMRGDQALVRLSVKEQNGIEQLVTHLKDSMNFHTGESTFIARRRHLDALERADQVLDEGAQQLTMHQAGELLAEDLRAAQDALNEITGEFSSDDLLGKIFSSFCIGK